MKTLNTILKARKARMVSDPNTEEGKWILQALVNIALNYKLSGNIGMYNHVIS